MKFLEEINKKNNIAHKLLEEKVFSGLKQYKQWLAAGVDADIFKNTQSLLLNDEEADSLKNVKMIHRSSYLVRHPVYFLTLKLLYDTEPKKYQQTYELASTHYQDLIKKRVSNINKPYTSFPSTNALLLQILLSSDRKNIPGILQFVYENHKTMGEQAVKQFFDNAFEELEKAEGISEMLSTGKRQWEENDMFNYYQGLICLDNKDLENAEKYFNKCLPEFPKRWFGRSRLALANYYAQIGNETLAKQYKAEYFISYGEYCLQLTSDNGFVMKEPFEYYNDLEKYLVQPFLESLNKQPLEQTPKTTYGKNF